jgi:hypothetical protein
MEFRVISIMSQGKVRLKREDKDEVRCTREMKRSGFNIIEDKMASPCLKIGIIITTA